MNDRDRYVVIKIVGIYICFGVLWIFFSDMVAGRLVHDPVLLTRIAVMKDLLFIAVTATLLFFLIHRYAQRCERAAGRLREHEELLNNVTTNIPGVICQVYVTDSGAYSASYVSERFSEIFGISADLDSLFQTFTAQVSAEDRGGFLDSIRDAVAASSPWNFEGRFIRPSGEVMWFNGMFSPRRGEPGRILYSGLVLDITARKQAEEEKLHLQAQLIQAQKMEAVGRLAGGVAHDFNNMLSVIIGNTELSLSDLDHSDPLYANLQEILAAGKRSAELTRQLLAFARKQSVSPKVLELNHTVSGLLKMLRRLIGEDIDLTWIPGDDLWTVRIDPSQVDQVLANLIVNARDAIVGEGKVTIATYNTRCDKAYCTSQPDCLPGEYVVLAVSDNGCGMGRQTLDSIFEPFFTTKETGKGTGLGLSTVYGIVKQNSGFINVYSEPGQGTTFRIHLPRYADVVSVTTEGKKRPGMPRGTEMVLIVEDEETVLNLSRAILEGLGYRVLAFRKAAEAIRQVREYAGDIDLLLTDVVMPDMSGRDLSAQLAAIRPGLKSLYMSGYTADVIAMHGVLEEGIPFISKPFTLQALAAKVRETLDLA